MKTLAYVPGNKYPTVSITGLKCSLRCRFCEGRYLRGMLQAQTPHQLYDLARRLHKNNAVGLLISGGFDSEGKLPIKDFLPTIREIKRDFNLIVSVHPGLVDGAMAVKLRSAKVDVVDYELILDDIVINSLMKLERTADDFIRGFKLLMEEGPPYIAPHIPIGLNFGEISSELTGVDLVSDLKPYLLTFLVFNPTRGTSMEDASPPSIEEVSMIFRYARRTFRGEIALGCMRPERYKENLDLKLIREKLVDRLAVPRRKIAEKLRLRTVQACCSVPHELLTTT